RSSVGTAASSPRSTPPRRREPPVAPAPHRTSPRSWSAWRTRTRPYTPSVLSRRSGEKILSCPGNKEQMEEEERRPSRAPRRLLTRGPNPTEPPEAQPQTVPVSKRERRGRFKRTLPLGGPV